LDGLLNPYPLIGNQYTHILFWVKAYFEEILFLEEKPRMRKVQDGRKISMCEESMQGMHVGKPNHNRVRVF